MATVRQLLSGFICVIIALKPFNSRNRRGRTSLLDWSRAGRLAMFAFAILMAIPAIPLLAGGQAGPMKLLNPAT